MASALDDIKNGKSFETVGRLTDILLEGVNLFETVSAVSGGGHLSVEEFVHLLPMPSRCQLQDHPIQHMLSETAVRDYLTDVLRGRSAPVGIVLTKPPETVAIVAHNGKYYFFDSHSRPQFGIEGAYLVSCDSIEGVVRRILLVFPPMESCGDLMLDMTYNSFEGSLFQDATLI